MAGPDKKGLIQGLTRAYADEWYAHYNYSFVANTISGPAAPAVIQILRRKVERALAHADWLAERILSLGGMPVPKLTALPEYATDKPFKLPENVRDIDGALRAVLERSGPASGLIVRSTKRQRRKTPSHMILPWNY